MGHCTDYWKTYKFDRKFQSHKSPKANFWASYNGTLNFIDKSGLPKLLFSKKKIVILLFCCAFGQQTSFLKNIGSTDLKLMYSLTIICVSVAKCTYFVNLQPKQAKVAKLKCYKKIFKHFQHLNLNFFLPALHNRDQYIHSKK